MTRLREGVAWVAQFLFWLGLFGALTIHFLRPGTSYGIMFRYVGF